MDDRVHGCVKQGSSGIKRNSNAASSGSSVLFEGKERRKEEKVVESSPCSVGDSIDCSYFSNSQNSHQYNHQHLETQPPNGTLQADYISTTTNSRDTEISAQQQLVPQTKQVELVPKHEPRLHKNSSEILNNVEKVDQNFAAVSNCTRLKVDRYPKSALQSTPVQKSDCSGSSNNSSKSSSALLTNLPSSALFDTPYHHRKCSSDIVTFDQSPTLTSGGPYDLQFKHPKHLYQKVTKQQFVVTRKTNYTIRASASPKVNKLNSNQNHLSVPSCINKGNLSRSEGSITDAIVNVDEVVSKLADRSERISCEKSEVDVTCVKVGDRVTLWETSENKRVAKDSKSSEVETFISRVDSSYSFVSPEQLSTHEKATHLIESLSEALHRHFPHVLQSDSDSHCYLISTDQQQQQEHSRSNPKSSENVENVPLTTANLADNLAKPYSKEEEPVVISTKKKDSNKDDRLEGQKQQHQQEKMAKLRSSFYKLAWPSSAAIASESDRRLWKTIFTTLNESKHNLENSAINSNVGNRKKESSQPVVVINDDEESLSDKLDSLELPDSFNHSNQRTIRSNRNNRDRSHSESSQVLLGDRDPILRQNQPKHLSPPQSQRHRHHSKSLSTASSSLLLEDEETSAFPPADDVISDDEDAINGAIIDDVVDRAFQRRSSDDDELGVNNNNNNNNGYSSVSESSILAMDDVCSLVLYDTQPLPKTAVDYYTQKSRSVDNLDGGPPINSVVPSTDTSDGSNHLNTPPPSHTKGGSMNDLLDSSSGHSGGNSGVSGGGVRNMGGRRSEGRVTVHSTTNASTHLKCTVKGGTVDVLIAYATQDSIDDWRFYEAFLTTYRTFISVEELLTKLIVRYRILHHLASSAITNGSSYGLRQREKRLRTAKNCFFLFLRTAWELKRDTEVDRAGPLIAQFRSVLIAVKEERDAKLLSDLMHAKLTDNSNNGYYDHLSSSEGSQQNSPSPLSLNSPSSINRTRQLTDFKSKAIAEQLTLICSKLFQSIELSEILACAKSGSGGREDQMPNVLAFTRHWNKLSNWVASCVLSAGATSDGHNHEKQIRERTHLKFIKVLKHLSEMNNFSSCFAVLCGLNINPVSRLDWPKSSIETLSSVSELLSPFHHFRNYREALSLSQGACIPHLAIVLHDLQQIAVMDDTLAVSHSHQNRSDIDSDIGGSSAVINFTKRWHQYLCLVRLRDTGSMHYYIKENAEIMTCFADFEPCLDESELHRMSNAIKPRRT